MKRLICIAFVCATLLCVVGCSKKEKDSAASKAESITSEELSQIDVIAEELVTKWEGFCSYGSCCDMKDVTESPEAEEIRETLSDDRLAYYGGLFEISCCKTVDDAREHINTYISQAYTATVDLFYTENLLEYNGKLYYIRGVGEPFLYDHDTIETTTDEKGGVLTITATRLEKDMVDIITAKKENGAFKITDCANGNK